MSNLTDWTHEEVLNWLTVNNFSDEVNAFTENKIRGAHLLKLNDASLKEMGVVALGTRLDIMEAIKTLKNEHNIVEVAAGLGHLKKRLKMGRETSAAPPVLEYVGNPMFGLSEPYLKATGLPEKKKLLLYCRKNFREQMLFLKNILSTKRPQPPIVNANPYNSGWILGPPGTGKSTTTIAFMASMDRKQWTITWVHISKDTFPVCVQIDETERHAFNLYDDTELGDILARVSEERNHIVFIDGYTTGSLLVKRTCNQWLTENWEHRRLVFICSLPSRGKSSDDEDRILGIQEFHVNSWTLDEYKEAVKHDAFFNANKSQLDASEKHYLTSTTSEDPSRNDLIESKYYFAGGSSRYMFDRTTVEVVAQLHNAVDTVSDVATYLQGTIGDRSNNVINRLFGRQVDSMGRQTNMIISQYAASRLAMKKGPDLLRQLAALFRSNPSMEEWIFEMWFFATLANGGIHIDGTHWPESEVDVLDENIFAQLQDRKDGAWLKPLKWNQGGYDAVHVNCPAKLVRFVQVTKAIEHPFKIGYFWKLLDKFKAYFETVTLEVYFLIPKSNEAVFKISTIEGAGLLQAFTGWDKGTEMQAVKICGVDWLE